jgi:hypothetical protein
MRPVALLLSVFIAVGIAMAEEPSAASASSTAAGTLSVQTLSPIANLDSDRHFGVIRPHSEQLKDDDDQTCYKLRTYFVERDSRSSDLVHGAGYESCQAASKFGLKKALPIDYPPPN